MSRVASHIHLLLLLAAAVLTACSGQTVYHAFRPVPDGGWHRTDTLFFSIPSVDSLAVEADVELQLRYALSYPYRNLSLRLGIVPDSLTAHVAPVSLSLMLTDDDGRPLGQGIGVLHTLTAHALRLRLSPGGTQLYVLPHMTDSCLTGISDVGLLVRRVK